MNALQRVRYFQRQLLTVEDMSDEQRYILEKLRRHNRFLHGWGVVCGCDVTPTAPMQSPWQVTVCCGYVLTPQGDEVWISTPVTIDLAVGPPQADPNASCSYGPNKATAGAQIYLAVRYMTCEARPIRVQPAGCGCEEAGCEFSRVRDDLEFTLLTAIPTSYAAALAADATWRDALAKWQNSPAPGPRPVPPCPSPAECDGPWVVLATITLPAKTTTPITVDAISYKDRRIVETLIRPVTAAYLQI